MTGSKSKHCQVPVLRMKGKSPGLWSHMCIKTTQNSICPNEGLDQIISNCTYQFSLFVPLPSDPPLLIKVSTFKFSWYPSLLEIQALEKWLIGYVYVLRITKFEILPISLTLVRQLVLDHSYKFSGKRQHLHSILLLRYFFTCFCQLRGKRFFISQFINSKVLYNTYLTLA